MNEKKYWTPDEVLDGIKEKPASERGTYPRYTVISDGEHRECNTRPKLAKILLSTYWTAPRVFINAGKGVTIDFDQDPALIETK